MSENPSDQEPSIEEILASIRQIISDDDDEEVQDMDMADEVVEEQEPEEPEEDVLELTEDMQDKTDFDEDNVALDFVDANDEEEEVVIEDESEDPFPEPEETYESVPSSILSEPTQQATMSSLSKLVGSMPLNRRGYDGVTLEDIVRELLHPMLREWMDDNLPPMVERMVQKELEKLSRRAMDD